MEKPFLQVLTLSKPYFSEVRRRVFFCGSFFLLVFVVSFFFSKNIIKFFLDILQVENVQIVTTSPFQFFGLAINIAISAAIIVTFPLIIYNIFSFFSPALTKKEQKKMIKVIFASAIFFIVGFLFGFNILKYVLETLAKYNTDMGLANLWDVGIFSSQIFLTASLMGIIFQFPIILSVLIQQKILKLETLKKKRKWAFFLAFAVSSLLPPTDGISLIIMALPLIIVFEITLFYNRKINFKKIKC
jgi:sec-independent protein translocase protein TatC